MFSSEKDNIHFEFLTKQIAADIKKGRRYANMIRLLQRFGLFTARRAPTHLGLYVFDDDDDDAVFEKEKKTALRFRKADLTSDLIRSGRLTFPHRIKTVFTIHMIGVRWFVRNL